MQFADSQTKRPRRWELWRKIAEPSSGEELMRVVGSGWEAKLIGKGGASGPTKNQRGASARTTKTHVRTYGKTERCRAYQTPDCMYKCIRNVCLSFYGYEPMLGFTKKLNTLLRFFFIPVVIDEDRLLLLLLLLLLEHPSVYLEMATECDPVWVWSWRCSVERGCFAWASR